MHKGNLLVISHTEHYISDDNIIYGWGPTVRELNFLSNCFENITHIAPLYKSINLIPKSSLSYSNKNIRFVPGSPFGGSSLFKKILILFQIPNYLILIRRELLNSSYVQLRLPMALGVILLPFFTLLNCKKRNFKFWVKYAGNWNEINPPLSYGFQRWWLSKDFCNCSVTINGFWPKQSEHCISFENPCLSIEQLNNGKKIILNRTFKSPYKFVFIGRLEDEKGVKRILDSIDLIDPKLIHSIRFIGDGPLRYSYQAITLNYNNIIFDGSRSNDYIHSVLESSDFLLLPSTASEGFPKVIAEACCYGIIPIVSNVGSISHYINSRNGFIWEINGDKKFDLYFSELIKSFESNDLIKKSLLLSKVAEEFTFTNYFNKLNKYILN